MASMMSMPAMEPSLQMKLTSASQKIHMPQPPAMPKSMMPARDRVKIDPQRALEPTRKKLSTLEAQRIMAVVLESIRKMELMASLSFIIENIDRFKVVLGVDLVNALEEHRVIIESFEELRTTAEKMQKQHMQGQESSTRSGETNYLEISEEQTEIAPDVEDTETDHVSEDQQDVESEPKASIDIQSSSSQMDMVMRNLGHVAKQMQHSCQNIIRLFWNNPTARNSILQQDDCKTPEALEMVEEMIQLKEIVLHKLLTTPVEEQSRNEYLLGVSKCERYNAGIIEQLEAELKRSLQDKEEEISKKNEVIRQLQTEIHQIEKFSEETIKRTKSEAEKQEAADAKNSEGKRVKLQQEQATLKNQLQELINEHRDGEQVLRKKKFQVETEVENWIQRYDQDMGERQAEYEEIDKVYTDEKKQLNELEERFKTLEEEYNTIMEERRIAREKREAQERELQMSVHAATTIQAFWRSFKVRKALKSKKKKGGKKKGKK